VTVPRFLERRRRAELLLVVTFVVVTTFSSGDKRGFGSSAGAPDLLVRTRPGGRVYQLVTAQEEA